MTDLSKVVAPGKGEKREAFLGRCMEAEAGSFPDAKQRYAVCNSKFSKALEKGYGHLRQGKKRKMVKFRIDELAAVDRPAQEGARTVLMKRDDVEKLYRVSVLTSETEGHQHAIYLYSDEQGGNTSPSTEEDADAEHVHPWVLSPDGSVAIGASSGHTHTVDAQQMLGAMMVLGKSKEDTVEEEYWKREFSAQRREELAGSGAAMPDGSFPIVNASDLRNAMRAIGRAKNPAKAKAHIRRRAKALGLTDLLSDAFKSEEGLAATSDLLDNQHVDKETSMTEQEVLALKAKLARAEAVAQLTDAEKSYMKTLGEKDAESFLALSPADRATQVTKALEANPVVYTATDGTTFRKSDDPRLVSFAKQADESAKALKAEQEARANDLFVKRAETELKHYPGDQAAKVALLKAVAGIADEAQRKAVGAALVAGAAALAKAFVAVGTQEGSAGGAADATTAEAKLDTMAKKYAADHKVSEAAAFVKVLETDEGKALYAEYTNGRVAH